MKRGLERKQNPAPPSAAKNKDISKTVKSGVFQILYFLNVYENIQTIAIGVRVLT